MARDVPTMIVDDDESDEDFFELVVDDPPVPENDNTPFVYDEEQPNLIPQFEKHAKGLKALKKIEEQVFEDFDNAWEGTEPRRKKIKDNWKLFAGDLPAKDWPFKNAANAHVPLMFKTLTRVTFSVFSEIFGEWEGFYRVLPVGPNDEGVAEILTKHGNWQLRESIPDFYRQQMRALLLYFTTGDVVAHSYWDEFNNRPCHEILTCEDFVVPYVHVTTAPDYSDVPFRVRILHKYRHELSPMMKKWSNVEKVLKREHASLDDGPDQDHGFSTGKVLGQDMPTDQRVAPYKLLWYEGWTEHLPGQEKPRFIRCIVDYNSRQLLCLNIHEEANWQEKRRYEMQMADLTAYRTQLTEYQTQVSEMSTQRDMVAAQAQDPMADPIAVQAQLDQLDPAAVPPVLPPGWMQNPEEVDEFGVPLEEPKKPSRVPLHQFTHAVCIEPIVGNIGLGWGQMTADYNRAANVMLSQHIDQATLGNTWGLITAGNLQFESPLSFGPGKVNVAKGVTGPQLKDAIHELRPQPANPQLLEGVDRMDMYAEQAAQAPGVLSGESGKSGETYRGQAGRLEQATKQLSVSSRLYAETFLKPILKNNAHINSVFMADEEIIAVNNQLIGQVEEIKLGRKLYERDYRTQITADMSFMTRQQRIAQADEMLQIVAQVPPLQNNVPLQQYLLKKVFEARGHFDVIQLLGPMQPPPETPLGLPPAEPEPQPGMPPEQQAGPTA